MGMNSCVIARTKHTSHEPGADAVDKQTTSKILDQKLKNEDSPKQKQISRKEQFKQAVKTYGMVVVVFHITITIASLSFFYVLVSRYSAWPMQVEFGILEQDCNILYCSGLDVVDLLRKIGIGEAFLENHIAKGASTFLVAYAVHKLFVPARMAITLAATPVIVARLRQLGFLKNVS